MNIAPTLYADAVFLSPPWGGPQYLRQQVFDIDRMPISGTEIFNAAQLISHNICYFLPRNVDEDQLKGLANDGLIYSISSNSLFLIRRLGRI